jgi:hypothetical protein
MLEASLLEHVIMMDADEPRQWNMDLAPPM